MQQDRNLQRRSLIAAYIAFAAVLLAINVYSYLFYDGFLYIYPRHWKHAHSQYFAAFAVFGAISIVSLLTVLWFSKTFDSRFNKNLMLRNADSYFLLVLILGLSVVIAIAYFVLDRFENSADEFVMVFQAQTMADGQVYAPPPPVAGSFSNAWMIEGKDRWLGQYAPGWPAILTGAALAKIPLWLVNPIIGAVTVWLFYWLAKFAENRAVAASAVVIFVVTPFFLFNSASFFTHPSFALMATVYAFGIVRYLDSKKFGYLIMAGAGLGAAFSIRHYPAVLIFLPVLLIPGTLRERLKLLFGIGLGAGPFVLGVLAYNYAAYGNPFFVGHSMMPDDIRDPLRFEPLKGTVLTVKRFIELSGWCGPLILLLYGFSLVYKIRRREIGFLDYLFPIVVIGLFLFPYSSGNRYGPRYLYDVYPFLILGTVSGLASFASRNTGYWTRAVNNAVIATVIYGLCILPLVAVHFYELVSGRQALYRMVRAKNLQDAVVLVETWTGDRRRLQVQELIRNDPGLSAPVLYVRNLDPARIMEIFPKREVWVYRRDSDTAPAYLAKISNTRRP